MKLKRLIVIFDAPDLELESTFWAVLLDGTVDAEDDLHSVLVDGEWRLGFQLAPNHVRPAWPDGPQQQVHMDVWVDDLPSARANAIALGAIELQPSLEPEADEQFIVMADPAGHPFCLSWAARDNT